MQLEEIYQPIADDLIAVDKILKESVEDTSHESIPAISGYLFSNRGKGLRPAMLILAAKAASNQLSSAAYRQLINIASAMELIHIASLIHDDVIDCALIRHNKPTVNSKYGQDVSIVFGDYLYSIGFRLISSCLNPQVLSCIIDAAKAMCEGELAQICERGNPELLKERYLVIAKKKTASLFAACCQAGAIVSGSPQAIQEGLREYGLNLGIGFQIIDDCRDLMAEECEIGKITGSDFKMGELTLPLLNLFSIESADRDELAGLLERRSDKDAFLRLSQRFIHSQALHKTEQDAMFYLDKARDSLKILEDSEFKKSLLQLLDFVAARLKIAIK